MKVGEWGNSLDVRLPAAVVEVLQLQDGEEIEVHVDAPRVLPFVKKPDSAEMVARVRKLRGAIPKDFTFDRDEANERSPVLRQ